MTAGLYTYSVWHAGYRSHVTIDAYAADVETALRSLRRFVDRQNRRLARAGFPRRALIRRPHIGSVRLERGASPAASPPSGSGTGCSSRIPLPT